MTARRRGQAGAATAELALGIPLLVALTAGFVWMLAVGGPAALLISLVLGVRWQDTAHELAGTDPGPVSYLLLTPVVALVLAGGLLALARGIRWSTRRVVALLERKLKPSVAKVLGVVLVAFVAWSLLSGVAADAGLRALDASFALADQDTPSGVEQPTTPLRSGSEESLVPWESHGREGRTFVGRGPDAAQIEAMSDSHTATAFARIENHFFVNRGWWTEGQLIAGVDGIRHIPTVIVQGRHDVCTPMMTAWDLHTAWPEAEFVVVDDAGHSATEPGIQRALRAATDRFAG